MLDKIALSLTIIGSIVWGIIGIFGINIVELLFNGSLQIIARIIYTLVGLSGLWCISLIFRENSIANREM